MPSLGAGSLLVGGTADGHWDGAAARTGGAGVVEVAGADHGLRVDDDVEGTLRALGDVVAAVTAFVDRLPAAGGSSEA